MNTGIESWENVAELGPLYPFVGTEGFWVILCVAVWLGWTVWQMRAEKAHNDELVAELRKGNTIKEALE